MNHQVAGQNASSTYLKVVKRSQFISSDKVIINNYIKLSNAMNKKIKKD